MQPESTKIELFVAASRAALALSMISGIIEVDVTSLSRKTQELAVIAVTNSISGVMAIVASRSSCAAVNVSLGDTICSRTSIPMARSATEKISAFRDICDMPTATTVS
jgi:hypothetical protein